jgi:ferredoxin--NADP+ reductase
LVTDGELTAPSADGLDSTRRDAVASLVEASSSELGDGAEGDAGRTVQLHFGWSPEAINGSDSVEGIVFRNESGELLNLATDSVLTAIGFSEAADAPVRRMHHESAESDLDRGHLASGLYCVGWLRRGPQGTIPANRTDAKSVADTIAAAFDAGEFAPGKPGFAGLSSAR